MKNLFLKNRLLVLFIFVFMFSFSVLPSNAKALTQTEADGIILSLSLTGNDALAVKSLISNSEWASQFKIESFGSSTLRKGSKGNATQNIQLALNYLLSDQGIATDGKFGPLTKAYVEKFQFAYGLVKDGLVGKKTKAQIMSSIQEILNFANQKAVTLPATGLSSYGAKLNGYTKDGKDSFFEWGATQTFLDRKIQAQTGTSSIKSATLTGLTGGNYFVKFCTTIGEKVVCGQTRGFSATNSWITFGSGGNGGGGGGTTTYQCNDGIDNDSDGLVDYPYDLGCTWTTDNTEYNYIAPVVYECNDGIDNDINGLIDYPQDLGCTSSTDNIESGYIQQQPATKKPTVTTGAVSSATYDGGLLSGIFANGSGMSVWFDYNETGFGGGIFNSFSSTPKVVQTNSSGTYNYSVSGLKSSTLYYFRFVLKDSNGIYYYGNTMSFTTRSQVPAATTLSATEIGTTFATLNGYVDPRGLKGTYTFSWTTDIKNGTWKSSTPVSKLSAGNISYNVSSLVVGTTYYYKSTMNTSAGNTDGATISFTTTTTTPPVSDGSVLHSG